jgi:hypothetical protein
MNRNEIVDARLFGAAGWPVDRESANRLQTTRMSPCQIGIYPLELERGVCFGIPASWAEGVNAPAGRYCSRQFIRRDADAGTAVGRAKISPVGEIVPDASAAVLRTLMPPARAALIRSASLSAIGGRPSRLPSRLALVTSLNRPGGNLTGVTTSADLLIIKRLELVRELFPRAVVVGFFLNSRNPNSELFGMQTHCMATGVQPHRHADHFADYNNATRRASEWARCCPKRLRECGRDTPQQRSLPMVTDFIARAAARLGRVPWGAVVHNTPRLAHCRRRASSRTLC